MPRYVYKCIECEQIFDVVHSMSEQYENCEEVACDKNKKNVLNKVPSNLNFYRKKEFEHKTGDVVKTSIEEFKKDLKEQKKSLTGNEYDS
jgi:putative FmdB family regulatory protein